MEHRIGIRTGNSQFYKDYEKAMEKQKNPVIF